MEGMIEIAFSPTQVDIVSTKLRTWNLKHAGNIFFTEMVHSRVPDIKDGDPITIRRVATEIVDILTDERGGRFLKLKEGDLRPTSCFVMGRKHIINKVGHALRTANSRSELRAAMASNPAAAAVVVAKQIVKDKQIVKNKKSPDGATRAPGPQSAAVAVAVERSPKLKRPLGKSVTYKVKAGGSQSIHSYAVGLIESVCNDKENSPAYRVLDEPGAKYTLDDEPEKERRMRLQLCHRYVSASAAGMTPVLFSRKLLELWGGKLVAIKKEKSPRSSVSPPRQSDIPPPGFPDAGAVTTSPLALQNTVPMAVTKTIWSSVEPMQPGFAQSLASNAPVPDPMAAPMSAASMSAAPMRYYEPHLPGSFTPMPYAPAPAPDPMAGAPMAYEPNNLPGRFAPMPLPPAQIGFQNTYLPPPPSARVPTTQNIETSMPKGGQFTGTRHFGSQTLPIAAQQHVPMWPMTVPPIPVDAPDDQQYDDWPMTVAPAHDNQQHSNTNPPIQVAAPDDQQYNDWPMTVAPAHDKQQHSNTNPPIPVAAPDDQQYNDWPMTVAPAHDNQQHSNTNIH